jgi:hypothetical protein
MIYGYKFQAECDFLRTISILAPNEIYGVWQRVCDIQNLLRVRLFYNFYYSIAKDFKVI